MKRGAMQCLARSRAMRFEWQKLVTPLTNKSVVSEWQRREGEVNALLKDAREAPASVEPVDWAYWESKIQSKEVLAEMKAEYEALVFPTVQPFSEEANLKIAEIEKEVADAKKLAVHGTKEVMEVGKVIGTINKVKSEGLNWTMEQWYAFNPGLKEQHMAEYEDEDYLVSDETQKLESVDWKAAAKDFAAGVDTEMGPPDEKIGDFVTAEEIEIAKAGTWSISRIFASKAERDQIQAKVEKYQADALA